MTGFMPGDVAEIHGTSGMPDLNGLLVKVVRFRGAQQVHFPDGGGAVAYGYEIEGAEPYIRFAYPHQLRRPRFNVSADIVDSLRHAI